VHVRVKSSLVDPRAESLGTRSALAINVLKRTLELGVARSEPVRN
jgi:hypothetical protein